MPDFCARSTLNLWDQPLICGTLSQLKVATCLGELKRRGIMLTDDGVGQLTVDTDWCGCCRQLYMGNIQ